MGANLSLVLSIMMSIMKLNPGRNNTVSNNATTATGILFRMSLQTSSALNPFACPIQNKQQY